MQPKDSVRDNFSDTLEPSSVMATLSLLKGQDPFVTRNPLTNKLILIQSVHDDQALAVRVFDRLEEMCEAEEIIIWQPTNPQANKLLWAPEIHWLDGRWYVYYAACDGLNINHRIYVLESESEDPLGPYSDMGQLATGKGHWAIDFTVLEIEGNRYGLWSSVDTGSAQRVKHGEHEGLFPQNLYIASMSNPCTIAGKRTCISTPEYPWEMSIERINEAPQAMRHHGKIRVFYSANASWSAQYRQGMLALEGCDPLDPSSWIKHPQPVFTNHSAAALGVGHVSFLIDETARNGQDYIIYHSKREETSGWSDRCIHFHPFDCDTNSVPRFATYKGGSV